MKITVLTTSTVNTRTFYEPLSVLGRDVSIITYDVVDPAVVGDLPRQVEATHPDWVLYIGAIPEHHRNVPPVEVLAQIGCRHKMVLLCCDGAEPAWWPTLEEYYKRGIFTFVVNIDGVNAGPIGEHGGMIALCPVSIEPFTHVPSWGARPIDIGFPGGLHGSRRISMVNDLVHKGLLQHRQREEGATADYWKFMLSCWCIWNNPETGGGTSKHVKARFLEASLAGCIVLEEEGSPAADWFEEGRDYLTYRNAEDVRERRDFFRSRPVEARLIAERLATKVRRRHSPRIFWNRVEAAIGMAAPLNIEFSKPKLRKHAISYDPGRVSDLNVPLPRLLTAHNYHNIVYYNKEYFVVPYQVGTVCLENVADQMRPGIMRFASEQEARRSIGV
jgi:hypothetical protein